jgi:rhodanese-related sulfurtransferase
MYASIRPEVVLASPRADLRILDVRSGGEYASGHVPGAVHIPYDEVAMRLEQIGADRERTLVVYCETGVRAEVAERALRAAGYADVRHLEGDMHGWRKAGLPIESR